jgi:hypothetical protein
MIDHAGCSAGDGRSLPPRLYSRPATPEIPNVFFLPDAGPDSLYSSH